METEIAAYTINRAFTDAILSLNPIMSKLSNTKMKILLLPLKIKSDNAMPIRKADMLPKYDAWNDRPTPDFDTDGVAEEDDVAEEDGVMENNDEVTDDGVMDDYSMAQEHGVAEQDNVRNEFDIDEHNEVTQAMLTLIDL